MDYNQTYLLFVRPLPICKAIYRGPITPFITIGSGPTLYKYTVHLILAFFQGPKHLKKTPKGMTLGGATIKFGYNFTYPSAEI